MAKDVGDQLCSINGSTEELEISVRSTHNRMMGIRKQSRLRLLGSLHIRTSIVGWGLVLELGRQRQQPPSRRRGRGEQ